jgi:anti-sigma factor RsiW
MTADEHQPPDPRQLAAYADGELTDDARARIDAALADHPAAAEELRAQQEFARSNAEFWRAVAAPEPTDAAWDRTLGRIASALRESAPPRRPGFRRLPWLAVAVGTAAAALVWVVAGLNPPAGPNGLVLSVPVVPDPYDDGNDGEVLAVAKADDVEILSIREEDVPMLVVGRHPVPGPITLAGLDDVAVHSMAPDAEGHWPEARMGTENSDVPMIYVPLARTP